MSTTPREGRVLFTIFANALLLCSQKLLTAKNAKDRKGRKDSNLSSLIGDQGTTLRTRNYTKAATQAVRMRK